MVIKETIGSSCLNEEREIFVYLPPGYDVNEGAYYPCLYMLDGQNLFSTQGDSPYGKWDIDITADTMIEDCRIEEIIIVGISNSQWREYEYTPTFDASEECGGMADIYLQFITGEVIPFINERYRTITEREFTAISGSSLGGLFSLYALIQYPEIFASAAALSPSIWWDNRVILDMLSSCDYDPDSLRLWIDMGYYEEKDTEEDDPVGNSRTLCELLEEKGFEEGENFIYYEDPDGLHNEESWAGRMEMVMEFLFPKDIVDC